jgi:deoxycytidine triphosphate deaminase
MTTDIQKLEVKRRSTMRQNELSAHARRQAPLSLTSSNRSGAAAMNVVTTPVSGVFSDQAIDDLVQSGTLIVKETFEPDALQPASYDLKIRRDGALFAGDQYPPDSDDRLPLRVQLEPGQAAMFSTTAMFCMPSQVAGNVTIKNRLATEGLMLLSGLLIDPGYGSDDPVDGKQGCRLYLHVANIGRDRIDIYPEEEAIARVQFLSVCGGERASRPKIKASKWIDQIQPSLGFLTEMKALQEDVTSTSSMVQNVVMLGFVVLGITLIGVSLSTILSLATNTELVRELRAVWPHSASGKLSLAGVLLAVPLGVLVFCMLCSQAWRASQQRRRRRRRRALG